MIIGFIIISFCQLHSQSDWRKWEAKEINYTISKSSEIDEQSESGKSQKKSFGIKILSGLRSIYQYTISDLDGDNCPFYPSCSHFFIESVSQSNIFSGSLMFADRFTRDMNPFKKPERYFKLPRGKYFDPSHNYALNLRTIKFTPYGN